MLYKLKIYLIFEVKDIPRNYVLKQKSYIGDHIHF
jgi:hypothetical protein